MLCITNNEVGIKEEVEIESNGNEIMELKTMELGDDEEISFRSLHGFFKKVTIKLKGKTKWRKVVILIDSGATYNCVH